MNMGYFNFTIIKINFFKIKFWGIYEGGTKFQQVIGQISISSPLILISKRESLLSHLNDNGSLEKTNLTMKSQTKLYYKILYYKQYLESECFKNTNKAFI